MMKSPEKKWENVVTNVLKMNFLGILNGKN